MGDGQVRSAGYLERRELISNITQVLAVIAAAVRQPDRPDSQEFWEEFHRRVGAVKAAVAVERCVAVHEAFGLPSAALGHTAEQRFAEFKAWLTEQHIVVPCSIPVPSP
ncbi:MAG: hypothetical protein PHI63_05585 [Patescibacteria group bacterium]|nr:hypothetical protein [Patescibacteria group bacterium]